MRDIYPCFDLYIDGGMSSIYFYNALRFSTHGEYRVFVANENTDWFKPFPHHQLITNFDIGSLKLHSKESFNIKFNKDRFNIFSKKTIQHYDVELLDGCIEININSFLNFEKFLTKYLYYVDYLIDFEKKFIFLGVYKNNASIIFRDNIFTDIANNLERLVKNKVDLTGSSILTLKCKRMGDKLIIKYFINKFSNRFELYRACGINTPLLLIQSLLKRKVEVVLMVNCAYIKQIGGRIEYIFQDSCYVFDLDETLICRGVAVKELIKIFKKIKAIGFRVELLTRHALDIDKALIGIGLHKKDFDLIKKVEVNEKKSEFIKKGSIFIDNEFPQRKDVRVNSNCNVLDLDQIDFLNL
jgi:hypothetical protein